MSRNILYYSVSGWGHGRIALVLHGDDCRVYAEDMPERMLAALIACGQPGPIDAAVESFLRDYDVIVDPELARAYLRVTGAWDDDDLIDHNVNVQRLVWMAGCDLSAHASEDGDAYFYFSTY